MDKDFGDLKFGSNGGSSSFTLSVEDCEGDKVLSYEKRDLSWATVTSANTSDGLKITVECGPTQTQHNGSLIIKLNGKDCSNEGGIISCIQTAPSCGCGNFDLTTYSLTWPSNSKSATTVGYSERGGCITDITASSNEDHFTVNNDTTNGIIITPRDTNPNSGPINGKVTVTYKANGGDCDSKTIDLTHSGSDCGCGSFDMDTSAISWDSDEGRDVVKSKSYSENCVTVYDVSVGGTDSGHFHASNNNHKIEVYPDDINSSETSKYATVTVKYKTDTVADCGSKTFNVIHNGTGCECGILRFKIDGNSGTEAVWDYDEYGANNAKEITYSIADGKADCVETTPTISLEGLDASSFDSATTENGIKIWPTSPNQGSTRNAKLKYSYTLPSGTICDGSMDNVSLMQVENDYCKCDWLSVNCSATRKFPLNSQSQYGYTTYVLANGDTSGCGEFKEIKYNNGGSKPDWLSATATTVPGTTTRKQLTVTLKDSTYAGNSGRSCALKFIFERRSGSIVLDRGCEYDFNVIQTNDYLSCERLGANNMSAHSASTLYYTSGNQRVGSLGSYPSGTETYRILKENAIITSDSFSVPASATWISNFTTELHYQEISGEQKLTDVYVNADVTRNDTSAERKTTVTMRLDSNKLRDDFGVCNCPSSALTKTFVVVQKKNDQGDDCSCKESATTAERSVNAAAGPYEGEIGSSYLTSCFKNGEYRFILADKNHNIIQGSDSQFKTIPNYSWLSGMVEDKYYSSSDKHAAKIHLNYDANTSTSARTAVFYVRFNLDIEGVCERKVEFTQEGKVVDCDTLNSSIKERTYPRPYSGASATSVAYTDDLLVPDSRLSGKTISATKSWVNSVFVKSGDSDDLYADLKDNMTTSGDGSTYERETTIQAFFVDSQGKLISFSDTECSGTPITIKQEGYTGACPTIQSMSTDNMQPNYEGYGDLKSDGVTHWTCDEVGLGVLPAFYSGNSKSLFECNLVGCSTEYKGNTVPCYAVKASITDTGYIYGVSAVRDSSDINKYIIKGNVRNNGSIEEAVPVAINLTLMKYDYINGGDLIETNIKMVCNVVVLPEGKDCQGQPIT